MDTEPDDLPLIRCAVYTRQSVVRAGEDPALASCALQRTLYNVVPAEVEAALAHLPGVAAVAVVGRPDPMLGEEIVAVIELEKGTRTGPTELGEFARERLGRPKQPREVAFVDSLPLGPSRKVLKRVLRDQIVAKEIIPQVIPRKLDSSA